MITVHKHFTKTQKFNAKSSYNSLKNNQPIAWQRGRDKLIRQIVSNNDIKLNITKIDIR